MQKNWSTGIISNRYQCKPELWRQLRASFRDTGYVKLPEFLTPDAFRAVLSGVTRLHSARVRKDFGFCRNKQKRQSERCLIFANV
jgi:hypothetical protein